MTPVSIKTAVNARSATIHGLAPKKMVTTISPPKVRTIRTSDTAISTLDRTGNGRPEMSLNTARSLHNIVQPGAILGRGFRPDGPRFGDLRRMI
jgi:hypothetical protein